MTSSPFVRGFAVLALSVVFSGCSIKKMAINTVGNALADSGSSFATDDDPELVAAAVPFGLKTIEGLLAQSPRHKGLLSGRVQRLHAVRLRVRAAGGRLRRGAGPGPATAQRARAKKLFLRAVGYGMRGFEVEFPGFREQLRKDLDGTLAKVSRKHVPLIYYTAAAWAAAFAIDVADSELSVQQTTIEMMMRRALALDETWGQGSLHDFFISWEAAHVSAGGSYEKAAEHFARSKQLGGGLRVSPLVSYAESVLVSQQKKTEFEQLLNDALLIDISKAPPEHKLANVIAQRRARWLLSRVDELF